MPFWRAYYHLIWATKNREPLITPGIERQLYAHLIHVAADLGSYVYALDGWTDHVHMVAAVPPHLAISTFIKRLKGASSHGINLSGNNDYFAWQRGYGALTLGQRQLQDAVEYVRRQKQHHRDVTTISWLERIAEVDEGPTTLRPVEDLRSATVLRENGPIYLEPDDVAF